VWQAPRRMVWAVSDRKMHSVSPPSSMALGPSNLMVSRALSEQYPTAGLNVYVAGDGADIYEDTFLKVAMSRGGVFNPTLILVGIRLGIDRVTPSYWPSLIASLQSSQSIGIAGLVFQLRPHLLSTTNRDNP
jgi:hypothetical protein